MRSLCFFFSFFTTGTPMLFSIAALHCCSYWVFMGITSSFFFMYKASLAAPNPALQSNPLEVARLFRYNSRSRGCSTRFLWEYFDLLCFENTCHCTYLNFFNCLMIFSSSYDGRYTV